MNQIDKVLDSIDMVDDVTLEYSFNIVDSMFKAYEKSAIILENYEGDDLSSFTIFQEGEIMDNFKERGKGMSVLMKILSALPRLVMAIIDKIKKNSVKGIPKLQDHLNKMSERDKKTFLALKYYDKNVSLPRRIFGNILDWIKALAASSSLVIGAATQIFVLIFIAIGKKNTKDSEISKMIDEDVNKELCEALSKDEGITKLITGIRKQYADVQKTLTGSFNEVINIWNNKMPNCKKIFGSNAKYEIEQSSGLDIILEESDSKHATSLKLVVNDSLVQSQTTIIDELKFDNKIGRMLIPEEGKPINIFYNESKDKQLWSETKTIMTNMLKSIRTGVEGIGKPHPDIHDVSFLFDRRASERYKALENKVKNISTNVSKLISDERDNPTLTDSQSKEFFDNAEVFSNFMKELYCLIEKIDAFNKQVVNLYDKKLFDNIKSVNDKIDAHVNAIYSEMVDKKRSDKSAIKDYKKNIKENKKLTIVGGVDTGPRFEYQDK